MKCSKPRFAFRPLVENLESRLQPGSIITGQGYGWSLLADRLSILDQGSPDSQSLVAQSSSESSRPTQSITPTAVHSDNLDIAVASVAAARSTSLPVNNLVDNNLSASLTNNDLPNSAGTGHSNVLLLAAAAASSPVPAPATPVGSVPQSPTGVAAPAQPLASTGLNLHSVGSGLRAVPAHAINVNAPSVHTVTGYHTTSVVQVVPLDSAHGPINTALGGNQATINFLSYLPPGGTGPDSMNFVAVQNEGGSNFMYIAGSFTDANGQTHGYAAKLTDGATSAVWQVSITGPATGPDRATGLAVNTNGVYVVGTFADPTATTQPTDGFIAQLDPSTGANVHAPLIGTLSNATFAAVTTDSSGNVDVAGSVPDTTTTGQQDVVFLQLTSDLSTTNYGNAFRFTLGGNPASSAVTSGGGLIADSQGNAFFAGTIGIVGDPNNETFALFGRLNAAGDNIDWAFRLGNQTPGSGGMGTAVAFDPSTGNVVFTGSANDGGNAGNPLNQDLVLGRADPATGNLVDQSGGQGVYYIWSVDDRKAPIPSRAGDWTGNGLVVLADGSTIIIGAAYDPAAGTGAGDPTSVPSKGVDVTLTHFVTTDDNTTQNTDGDPENIFGGSGTDVGLAVAIDPTMLTQTSNVNVYVVGSTTSTDLPTTSGVVAPTYGGGSTTGFVGQAPIA